MPTTANSPAIEYVAEGNVGPKVLLIMGLGMGKEAWKPQLDGLACRCQLVAFDNRGIGGSAWDGTRFSMDDMARDAISVLDTLGWTDPVHVVGVSMGGMIAQELALEFPARVRSLSLLATHPGGPRTILPPARGLARFLAVHLSKKKNRPRALADLLYPTPFQTTENLTALDRRFRFEVGAPPTFPVLRRQLSAIRRHDTRSRLSNVTSPTLIIKPSLDILVAPKNSDLIHGLIPNSALLTLPDAGHGAMFQCADLINERLLDHFQRAEVTRE